MNETHKEWLVISRPNTQKDIFLNTDITKDTNTDINTNTYTDTSTDK